MSRKRPRREREERESLDRGLEKREQDREEYDAFGFLKSKKQAAAFAGAFFVIGFLISWFVNPPLTGQVIEAGVETDSDEIGEAGVAFLNKYFISEGEATLDSIEDKDSLYLVTLTYNGEDIPVYMTKDGEFLIAAGLGAINMAEYEEAAAAAQAQQAEQPQQTSVPKSDKPVANIYVMSFCPYGLQMEKAVIPVMELLGDKADINIDYVPYLMHGEKELVQNNYQHCIEKEQPEVFVEYLRCFVQSDDHEACMAEAGVDQASLDSCVASEDEKYNITGLFDDKSTWTGSTCPDPPYCFPLYMVDAALANQYGVGGSPTFVLNGQTVSVSRSPEAIKQAICDAFNTPPEECSTALSTEGASPGIGPLSGGDAGTSATC